MAVCASPSRYYGCTCIFQGHERRCCSCPVYHARRSRVCAPANLCASPLLRKIFRVVAFGSDVPPSLPPFLPPSLPVFLSHKHRHTPFLCSQIHCVTHLLLPPLPKKKKRRKERVGKMCNPAKCVVCAESISTT